MRYRPDEVSAAILAGRGRRSVARRAVLTSPDAGRLLAGPPRPRRHASRRFSASPVPAYEVAERAETIRRALDADGGFPRLESDRARRGADHRRPRPGSRALPRGGLVRGCGARASRARYLTADTYPNRSMFEGMSDEAVERLVREPESIGGRAGFWGLDTAAPLVAGTYVAARGGRRRRADRGRSRPRWRRRRRLRPVPPARPPRRALDVRRLLLLQQRRDRRRGDHGRTGERVAHPRCRLPPRQRQPADLLAPRRRPLRLDPRRPGAPVPVLPRACRRDRRGGWRRREPQPPAAGRHDQRRLPRRGRSGLRGDRRACRARSSWSRSASTPTAWTRSATSRSRRTSTTRSAGGSRRSAGGS